MKALQALCVLVTACWSALAAAGTGNINGNIIDAQTGEPLANASVFVVGTYRGAVSNYAGEFSIDGVPVGRQVLRACLLGYVTKELEVQLEANDTMHVGVKLDQDGAIRLEEIMVTARRASMYPQVDLQAQDVEQRSPRDVGVFLRTMPGASSIRKGGTALDPVIRGFRQDQINVQVDGGMKVWGACPNRMDPPTSHIQAEDLEKIEVFKGPFTVRFGPTFGPVVNLVMKKPEQFEQPGIRTQLEGGYESNGDGKRSRAMITAGLPVADVLVTGGVKQYGDYEAGDGSEVQSAFRMHDYSLKIGLNPGERQRIQFTNRGSYMRDVYYPALPMDAYVDDTHMYAIDYAGKSFGGVLSSLTVKGYGALVRHIMGNQWKPTYATMHAQTDVQSGTFGGRIEAMIVPFEAGALYAGVDGYDLMKSGDRVRAYVGGPNRGKTFLDTIWQDSHIRNTGAYLEARAFVNDELTTIGGIRFDHVRVKSDRPNSYYSSQFGDLLDVTENNISGVAALIYTLSPFVDMRFGVGHGMRTADITERFVYLQPVGMDRYDYIGNPALRPEQNTQLELATSAKINTVTLQVSVYQSFLSNYISAKVDTTVRQLSLDVLGVKRFVNVSVASMSGFEMSASKLIGFGLRLDLSAAYTRGQNRDVNEPLAEVPPLSAVALLHYQHEEEPLWGELECRFVSNQSRVSLAFQEQATPGFAVYSLRGGTQLFSHFGVTVAINNVFNKSYVEHLNRKSKADGQPILEPGRSFTINAQIMY